MPALAVKPKPTAELLAKAGLEKLGFRTGRSGPHAGRTLMLRELTQLLDTAAPDADASHYRAAIHNENVLGKPTASSRRDTSKRLRALHGLDPSLPLFRVFRRLWNLDPAARPLLALLNGLARDPLLRASAALVTGLTPGAELRRPALLEAIRSCSEDRLSPAVLDAVARNVGSSWTQAGHLRGKVRKVRQLVIPTPVAVSCALWLGYSEGRRDKSLLTTLWTSVLDSSPSALIELALQAKRLGLLEMTHGGGLLLINPTGLDPATQEVIT